MNKTTKYLFVPFAEEKKSFITYYNICYTAGGLKIFLDDANYEHNHEDCLFVYIDRTKVYKFEDILLFFRFYDTYLEDYPISSTEHMIIFKIDKSYRKTIEMFKEGKYSEMYDNRTIELFFSANHKSYYLKYKGVSITTSIKKTVIGSGDKQEEIKKIVIDNETILNNIRSLELDYKHLVLSQYHVLKKSEELQCILSCLYMVNPKYIKELDSKPLMEDEIFNYKKIN